jgi:HPt (histidine-containing phosphotransfer) domain-containing protein
MDAYLTKPVHAEHLVAMVHHWTVRETGSRPEARRPDRAAADQAGDGGAPGTTLDLSILRGLRDIGGPELIEEMVDLYRVGLDEQLSELTQSLADDDVEGLRRAAHAMSGSSANLGAVQLAAASADLEVDAGHGDLTGAEEAVTVIGALATVTLDALEDQVRAQSGPPVPSTVGAGARGDPSPDPSTRADRRRRRLPTVCLPPGGPMSKG